MQIEYSFLVTGKPARFVNVDPDFLKANGAPDEFVDTLKWFNTYGYYNNEDISATKQVSADLQGFEGWLQESGWRV